MFDKQQTHPSEIALSDLKTHRTWQQLQDNSVAIARYLHEEMALVPGDHISFLIGNRVEFVEFTWGALFAGLWLTPINTHLIREEAQYIVRDSGAKLVIHDAEHKHLIDGMTTCKTVCIDTQLGNKLDQQPTTPPSLSSPAGGTMLYTSGTTGKPKGVKRSKANTLREMLTGFKNTGKLFGLNGDGAHLVTGPLYHAAPMLFSLYDQINGAKLFIMPKWNEQLFLETVSAYKISHTHLVPTMFVRLLNHTENNREFNSLRSLTLILHGAAPIAKSTKHQMLDWWGNILVEYWGGTEAGITTMIDSQEWLEHPGTVGKPLSHFKVFAANDDLVPLPSGEIGPLYSEHKHLSQVFEYHNDPEKTAKAHPKPHIFSIGDMGYVSEEGYVYLSDRQSNTIISGGVNIYPAEVENILIEHPAVLDVAVFGIPNEEWGEQVKATIQLNPGVTESEDLKKDIINFTKERLSSFKVPRSIDVEEVLPRTPTGKLLIRKLRDKYQK